MAKPIKMPKLSDQMTEGKLAEWLKHEGDEVHAGDVVAQVETEKATLDVEAFESGVLIGVTVKAGETAPVGQPIAWIGARGEKVPEAPAAKAQPDAAVQERTSTATRRAGNGAPAPSPAPPSSGARQVPPGSGARASAGRVLASPAARKQARERGIELGDVEASGPGGRVVLADLERAHAPEPPPRAVQAPHPGRPGISPLPLAARGGEGQGEGAAARRAPPAAPRVAKRRQALPPRAELRDETLPLSPMRRAIARNLNVSKPGAPHFYLETSADMRRMVALREQLDELGEAPISLNDLVVKATAEALSRHPEVNAAWGADAIVRRGSIDVGVAVALEDGLVTPVVRDADRKSVFEIAAEIRDLAGRARDRRLAPDEYQGASFTISNLGMFGIEAFYAVINPPEAAILAVGTVQKVPWVDDATGELVAMERMRLGLSGDHRVIDGATGARFLQTLKAVLESPVRLLVG